MLLLWHAPLPLLVPLNVEHPVAGNVPVPIVPTGDVAASVTVPVGRLPVPVTVVTRFDDAIGFP